MTLYKVEFGFREGFDGAQESDIVNCESLENARKIAYDMAIKYAYRYKDIHGLPNLDKIMEEKNCSEEEAAEIYYDTLELRLKYSAEEYHE